MTPHLNQHSTNMERCNQKYNLKSMLWINCMFCFKQAYVTNQHTIQWEYLQTPWRLRIIHCTNWINLK